MNGTRGTVLAITASLIVGCAIGLIVGVLFARSMFFLPRGPFGGPGGHFHPPGRPGVVMDMLQHQLDLTKDQSDRIQKIVESSRADVDSIRAQTRQQILQVLTPEQRTKWERMDEHFFHHGGPPHGPGGPGDEPPPPPDRP